MRWLLAMALMIFALAGPGQAQDQYPALFDVKGVAADDMLNIRAAPDTAAEIVGMFDHNAEGIEVVRLDETGKWALVNYFDTSGWVSLRYLDRLPTTGSVWDIRPASCYGTEPFWGLTLGPDDSFVFETPEGDEPGTVINRTHAADRLDVRAVHSARR